MDTCSEAHPPSKSKPLSADGRWIIRSARSPMNLAHGPWTLLKQLTTISWLILSFARCSIRHHNLTIMMKQHVPQISNLLLTPRQAAFSGFRTSVQWQSLVLRLKRLSYHWVLIVIYKMEWVEQLCAPILVSCYEFWYPLQCSYSHHSRWTQRIS